MAGGRHKTLSRRIHDVIKFDTGEDPVHAITELIDELHGEDLTTFNRKHWIMMLRRIRVQMQTITDIVRKDLRKHKENPDAEQV